MAGVNNLGNLTALSIDAGGNLLVSATALPLPSGAATSANQVLEIAQLTAINGKLPAALGAQTIAASLSVNIASNQTVPVSAASLPLPTGAATSALQTTGNTSVASIDTKTPALGQAAMAASVPVAIASNQSTLPVSAASLPLPTGAATETTLAAMSAKLPATLGQKAMAAALAVSIASDQSTLPVSAASLPLPTGAATSALQTTGNTSLGSIDGKLGSLGQKAMSGSAPVVIASDQSALPVAASNGMAKANAPTYNDYSSSPVTTGAYVQLIASTTSAAKVIEIFDSSGQTMILAVGAAASEVDQFYIFPGGNGQVQLAIPAGSRISIKAKTASATTGYIAVNLYG